MLLAIMKVFTTVLAFSLLLAGCSGAADLPTGTKAPELVGSQWTGAKTPLSSLRGKVVLLHFWTFGCINCKHNLPVYERLQQRLGKAVATVGVHTPETEEERSFANLKREVARRHYNFTSVFDGSAKNWYRYRVQYWPTVFVLDKKGVIRGTWTGELNYGGANGEEEVARLITKLSRES